ncbi:MAG: hypothetical protein HQL29_01845 [Candidatus Omnitrophica bacterium]|nr:hypothetical protein [Candidatus Omnitrophota bacterium]
MTSDYENIEKVKLERIKLEKKMGLTEKFSKGLELLWESRGKSEADIDYKRLEYKIKDDFYIQTINTGDLTMVIHASEIVNGIYISYNFIHNNKKYTIVGTHKKFGGIKEINVHQEETTVFHAYKKNAFFSRGVNLTVFNPKDEWYGYLSSLMGSVVAELEPQLEEKYKKQRAENEKQRIEEEKTNWGI